MIFKNASVSNSEFLLVLVLYLMVIKSNYLSVDITHIFVNNYRGSSTFRQICGQKHLLVLLSVLNSFLVVKYWEGEV